MYVKPLAESFVNQLQLLRANRSISNKPEIVAVIDELVVEANDYLTLTEGEIAREKSEDADRLAEIDELQAELLPDGDGLVVVATETGAAANDTEDKDTTLLSLLLYAQAESLNKKTKKLSELVKKTLQKSEEPGFDWTDFKLKVARAAYRGQDLVNKLKATGAGNPLEALAALSENPEAQDVYKSLGLDQLVGYVQGLVPSLDEIKAEFQQDGQHGLVGAAAGVVAQKVLGNTISNGGSFLLRKGDEAVCACDTKIALALADSIVSQCNAFVSVAQLQLTREQIAGKFALIRAAVGNSSLAGFAQSVVSRFAVAGAKQAAKKAFDLVGSKIVVNGMPATALVNIFEQMFASEPDSNAQQPQDDQQPAPVNQPVVEQPEPAGDSPDNQPPASPEADGKNPSSPPDQPSVN